MAVARLLCIVVLILASTGLVGCGESDDGAGAGSSSAEATPAGATEYPAPRPRGSLRPDLMSLQPSTVEPGGQFSVELLGEDVAGVAFTLQQDVASGWVVRYTFITPISGPGPGTWFPPGAEVAYPDVGFAGPLNAVIPEGVAPGAYRFCTANAGDEYCAAVTVREPN